MFHRLLVAIDASPSTPVTLGFATALARGNRASVLVVHVNPRLGGRGFPVLPADEARELVDGAVRQLEEEGVLATGAVVGATVADLPRQIVDVARKDQAEAIILGSRRRRFGRRFGKGIRERVTTLSSLPILVAPPALEVPRVASGQSRSWWSRGGTRLWSAEPSVVSTANDRQGATPDVRAAGRRT